MTPVGWVMAGAFVVRAVSLLLVEYRRFHRVCERCGKALPQETISDLFYQLHVCSACARAIERRGRRTLVLLGAGLIAAVAVAGMANLCDAFPGCHFSTPWRVGAVASGLLLATALSWVALRRRW